MPRRPKLALGPEDGKGFNGLTYKRTVQEPAAAVVKVPSPRMQRSNSISVQDLLLRRHPLGVRVRDVSRYASSSSSSCASLSSSSSTSSSARISAPDRA